MTILASVLHDASENWTDESGTAPQQKQGLVRRDAVAATLAAWLLLMGAAYWGAPHDVAVALAAAAALTAAGSSLAAVADTAASLARALDGTPPGSPFGWVGRGGDVGGFGDTPAPTGAVSPRRAEAAADAAADFLGAALRRGCGGRRRLSMCSRERRRRRWACYRASTCSCCDSN